MKRMSLFGAFVLFWFFVSGVAAEPISAELTNGLYLVQAEFSAPELGRYLPIGFRLVQYNSDHLVSRNTEQTDPIRYIVIKDAPSVPIVLSDMPELSKTNDKYEWELQFTLAPECVVQMEEFTGNNLNKKAALVIGGKIITIHKIRAAIKNGQIQITRCTDNGCKVIYRNLLKSDMIKKKTK